MGPNGQLRHAAFLVAVMVAGCETGPEASARRTPPAPAPADEVSVDEADGPDPVRRSNSPLEPDLSDERSQTTEPSVALATPIPRRIVVVNETDQPIELLHAYQLLFLRAFSADDAEAVYMLDGWDCAEYTSGIQLEPPAIMPRREAAPRVAAGRRRSFEWDGWLFRTRPGEGCADRVPPPAGETTFVACTGEDWRADGTRCTKARLDLAASSEPLVLTFAPEPASVAGPCAALGPSTPERAIATIRELADGAGAACPRLSWECIDTPPSAAEAAARQARDGCHVVLRPAAGFVRLTLHVPGNEPQELLTDPSGAWLWYGGALRLPNGRQHYAWAPSEVEGPMDRARDRGSRSVREKTSAPPASRREGR